MTSNEMTGCFHPIDVSYVCKEEIPIHIYIPETDCESTLLHPSTIKIPYNCEYRFLKLKQTLWIPVHLSNEWLYVAPESETLTVLCPEETTTLKIQAKGKLTLKAGCKGNSSYVTLYAMSAITTNLTTDYIPSAPVNFDCCLEDVERVNFEELPLHVPLANVMSNMDDLRVASMKAEEIEQMIKDQEAKHNQNLYLMATSWGTTLVTIFIVATCICCSCCFCVVGTDSFGFGTDGVRQIAGRIHKTSVVSAFTIIMALESSIQKRIPLQQSQLDHYLSWNVLSPLSPENK
jgi:hypothetical protein